MSRRTPVQADLLLRVTIPESTIPERVQATVLQLMAQLLIEELEIANDRTDRHEDDDNE